MSVILFLIMTNSATGLEMEVTRTVPNPPNAFGLCRNWIETGADEFAANYNGFDTVSETHCTITAE